MVPSVSPAMGRQVGEVFVGAGEMKEQVADGENAETLELFEPIIADAAQSVDALAERIGR